MKVLNRLFPCTSAADEAHQTLHMADTVWWALHYKAQDRGDTDPKKDTVPARLRRVNYVLQHIPVGTPQPLAIALLCAAIFHEHRGDVLVEILERGLLWAPPCLQAKRLKALSTLVRKSGSLPLQQVDDDERVCAVAYYELCFGRSEHTTDWEAERANRCRHTLHIQHPGTRPVDNHSHWRTDESAMNPAHCQADDKFYEDLYNEVLAICKPLVTKRNTKETLERFVKRRHEWMASGSSAGFVVDVKSRGGAGSKRVKGQKRAWAESIDYEDVKRFMETTVPREVAHASEKMENGKARAIYGVEPMHYLINTYATKGFEERLHLVPGLEKGLKGHALSRAEGRRAMLTGDRSVECTMLDYADFNRHHTPRAQEILFLALAQLGSEVGASHDWVAANRWVASAKRRMAVIFPESRIEERVVQGMFSGTRSTDLINTILNLAYFNIAAKHVRDSYGVQPVDLYNVHQGDDVWISNRNKLWARLVFYTLNRMGFIFQINKQMFGPQRGEYLRVLYSHGKGYGYFARAMANYILRPVQQKMPLSPQSWAQTIGDAMSLLCRRGLSLAGCDALFQNGVGYWVRARAHPRDHAPVCVPDILRSAPQACGGLGCSPPGTLYTGPDLRRECTVPTLKSTVSTKGRGLPSKMTDDWIEHVSSIVTRDPDRRSFDATAVREAIHALNYGDVIEQVETERGWAAYKVDMAKLRDRLSQAKLASKSDYLATVLKSRVTTPEAVEAVIEHSPWTTPGRGAAALWVTSAAEVMWSPHVVDRDLPNFTPTTDALQAAITKSKFKSHSLTAQAYHISRQEAIAHIATEANFVGGLNEASSALVALVLGCGNPEVMDAFVEGAGKLFPVMAYVANECLWETVEKGLVETLAQTLRMQPAHTLGDMLYQHGVFNSLWLRAMARGPNGAGHPVQY